MACIIEMFLENAGDLPPLAHINVNLQDPSWSRNFDEQQDVYVETDVDGWPRAYTTFKWKDVVQDVMHYCTQKETHFASEIASLEEDLWTMAKRGRDLRHASGLWCVLNALHFLRCGEAVFSVPVSEQIQKSC